MRIFIVSLGLLIALLAALGGYSMFLKNNTRDLLEHVDTLDRAAREEDWAAAEAALSETANAWEEASPRFALFITHEILDDIMHTLAEAKGYLYFRESPELMAETETLRVLIEHIEKREAPSVHNIF